MITSGFSWFRLYGLIIKEFTQFLRDRSTFAMVIGLPIVQLILFGLAINTNPHYLPIALLNADGGSFARTLVHEFQNTGYFRFVENANTEQEALYMMQRHQTLFTLSIPSDFSKNLVRGKNPSALLEVDGTDPVSVAYAVSAVNGVMNELYQYDLVGSLEKLAPNTPPANLIIHTKYNPLGITQYNVIPGLLGTVLTMTFVMVAAMALTRERERGTMESLLSTPILPLEVIIGKATPFLIVGYLQVVIVITLAVFFFHIPLLGSVTLLFLVTFPFILANLFVGILISTLCKTQLAASQLSIFFFLPSMLLSGFAFPFYGMPSWAQWIGNCLPLTHFINMIRGIMLKGVGFKVIWFDLLPVVVFLLVMFTVALKRYKQTLD